MIPDDGDSMGDRLGEFWPKEWLVLGVGIALILLGAWMMWGRSSTDPYAEYLESLPPDAFVITNLKTGDLECRRLPGEAYTCKKVAPYMGQHKTLP